MKIEKFEHREVVEAVQFTGDNIKILEKWLKRKIEKLNPISGEKAIRIHGFFEPVTALEGDYIFKNSYECQVHVMSPDLFEFMYEKIETDNKGVKYEGD